MLGLLLTALLSAALPASAADLSAADALYFHRNEPQKLDQALAAYDELLKAAPDDPALLWRKGRALMRRGERQARKAEKLADFFLAEDLLRKSIELKPDSPDAHYFFGVTMGLRGEAQGIMKSLFLIKPLKAQMNEVLRLDPHFGGAYRVFGELYWKVPGFVGGDKKLALANFELAVKNSPNYTSNYVPLAEAYIYFKRLDDARKALEQGLGIVEPLDPATRDDDFAEMRKLLDKINSKKH